MDRLESEIRILFETEGIELLELTQRGSGSRLQVRIIADRKVGGLSIDDCVHVTRQVQFLIAEKNLLPADFTLEVGSPGLDYPLRESWQYNKNIGRLLKIRVPGERGPKEIHGRLKSLTDSGILVTDGNREFNLRQSDILSASVLPEFNTNPAKTRRAQEPER